MSDLTRIEERFRTANPIPDPANPPVTMSTAAAILSDLTERNAPMKTQEETREAAPPDRRRNGMLVAAGVLLVALIAGGAYLLTTGDGSEPSPATQPPVETTQATVETTQATVETTPLALDPFCFLDGQMAQSPAPSELGDQASEVRALIAEWRDTAPDEIRPSAEIHAAALIGLIDVWESGNFDQAQVDSNELQAAFDRFFGSANDEATTIVETWVNTNCIPFQ